MLSSEGLARSTWEVCVVGMKPIVRNRPPPPLNVSRQFPSTVRKKSVGGRVDALLFHLSFVSFGRVGVSALTPCSRWGYRIPTRRRGQGECTVVAGQFLIAESWVSQRVDYLWCVGTDGAR